MFACTEKPTMAQLKEGVAIVYEFGAILFFGVIDDASMLPTGDRLKVTFYHASDPKFAPHLPEQLWLSSVSGQLRACKLRFPETSQWLLLKGAAA